MWAKFEALVEGAALATQKLWQLTCPLRLGKPRKAMTVIPAKAEIQKPCTEGDGTLATLGTSLV